MNDEIKIIKGEPIPDDLKAKYPFGDMDVGDMFHLPPDHSGTICFSSGRLTRVAAAASNFGRRHDMKFTIRTQADKSVKVWRVE